MKLSDQIIEHGPYEAGQRAPIGLRDAYLIEAEDLNELREELLAARKVGEVRFDVAGAENDVEIICQACTWFARVPAWSDLAELDRRAGEHAEVCG